MLEGFSDMEDPFCLSASVPMKTAIHMKTGLVYWKVLPFLPLLPQYRNLKWYSIQGGQGGVFQKLSPFFLVAPVPFLCMKTRLSQLWVN